MRKSLAIGLGVAFGVLLACNVRAGDGNRNDHNTTVNCPEPPACVCPNAPTPASDPAPEPTRFVVCRERKDGSLKCPEAFSGHRKVSVAIQ